MSQYDNKQFIRKKLKKVTKTGIILMKKKEKAQPTIEIKVFQDRKRNSRFKKYKAHRDGELESNITNSDAMNELADCALDVKGF